MPMVSELGTLVTVARSAASDAWPIGEHKFIVSFMSSRRTGPASWLGSPRTEGREWRREVAHRR
jgi:hypothetical protein